MPQSFSLKLSEEKYAIGAEKSHEYNHGGVMYAFAANSDLVEHYVNELHAQHVPAMHEYQVIFDEESAKILREVYTYDWSNA